jgi:hypothetical protein
MSVLHDERLAAGEVARLGIEALGLVRIAAPDRYDLATLQDASDTETA